LIRDIEQAQHPTILAEKGPAHSAPYAATALGERTGRVVAGLFAVTIFVGSALLFWVELMIAKMILPKFGGAPAVWNTCVLFFQATLLAGYAYVHVTPFRLGLRGQLLLHTLLFVLAVLVLPVAVTSDWAPPGGAAPGPWLLGALLTSAAIPFFVVASGAPLLQRWFHYTGYRRADDPYFLYATSNAGSLLGLLAYPFLIEPFISLRAQSWLWSAGFVVLAALTVGCGFSAMRRIRPGPARPKGVSMRSRGSPHTARGPIAVRERARWMVLAFVPSSMMLGVTTYLATDIASVPMLWVLPLALYLLSFILAFGRLPAWFHRLLVIALAVVAVAQAFVIVAGTVQSVPKLIGLHLVGFFLAAIVCHAELARRRPPAVHLTEYYLWLSLGGVLGGVFNTLVAPVLFVSQTEYPLMIVLALVLMPPAIRAAGKTARALDFVLPALIGLLAFGLAYWWGNAQPSWQYGMPAAACLLFMRRPLRIGLAVASLLLAGQLLPGQCSVLYRERDFFGTHRVLANPQNHVHWLIHGRVEHGAQRYVPDPLARSQPLLYYFPTGPIGQVFASLHRESPPRQVGVIGLGAGALAAYAKKGQHFTFFEIDPAVARIARNPDYFTYLSEGTGAYRVVLGDARLSLAREPAGRYGLMVLDAFSSDAIPVHLLTVNAIELYLEKLADDGLIALHISNGYFDLEPVVGAAAATLGLAVLSQKEDPRLIPAAEQRAGKRPSHWVLLARRHRDFGILAADPRWRRPATPAGFAAWTDDYSNLLRVLR
jgi:hypothetical protein